MAEMTARIATHPPNDARLSSSLRVRLAMAIAISVAVTGSGARWLALQLARQALTEEVRGIARQAAERAAELVKVLPTPLSLDDAARTLRTVDAEIAEIETLAYLTERD